MPKDVNIAERVLEEGGISEREVPIPRIIAMIPSALSALSYSVARDPDRRRRQLLRRTFESVIITDGVGTLTDILNDERPPILELNASWDVILDLIESKAQNLIDGTAQAADRPPGFAWFRVAGTNIIVDDGSNDPLNLYQGNVFITGSYVASLDDLYGELDDNLIRILLERLGRPTAPDTAEAEARR